jgi:hypothetical protein
MATTVGDSISRVRNVLKAVKEDPFLTDRFIYSIILKYGKTLLKRQDDLKQIMKYQSLFEVLPCVELIEIDKVEACCSGIKSKCRIMRTKEKIPPPLEGSYGPLIRNVTSIDSSIEMISTYPSTYVSLSNSTNFKYNKSKYFWYVDGHLYFPNIDWDAVRIEALFDGDVTHLKTDSDPCTLIQDTFFRIPDFLFSEVEQYAIKEILTSGQIPADGADDNQNIFR